MPGPAPKHCLAGKVTGLEGVCNPGLPTARYDSKCESAEEGNADEMASWMSEVLTADDRNAGNASKDTLLKPMPPCLIGSEGWSHCKSERSQLVRTGADCRKLSKTWRAA